MKKYVENDTAHMIYVGGCAIAPGEGREVEAPGEAREAAPAPAEPTLAEQVALMLKDSVKKISASLDALNGDTLDTMAELEAAADKPRSTLLEAISDEKIKRANDALASDPL